MERDIIYQNFVFACKDIWSLNFISDRQPSWSQRSTQDQWFSPWTKNNNNKKNYFTKFQSFRILFISQEKLPREVKSRKPSATVPGNRENACIPRSVSRRLSARMMSRCDKCGLEGRETATSQREGEHEWEEGDQPRTRPRACAGIFRTYINTCAHIILCMRIQCYKQDFTIVVQSRGFVWVELFLKNTRRTLWIPINVDYVGSRNWSQPPSALPAQRETAKWIH